MIYLVRHAHAGSKRTWPDNDERRPLSAKGHDEAAGLVAQLRPYHIGEVVSAPALRCVQTAQVLADARRLPLRQDPRLRVEADVDQALALLEEADARDAVLCTHGELIGKLLERLRDRGLPLGDHAKWPKGSTWVLRGGAEQQPAASYLPPLRP